MIIESVILRHLRMPLQSHFETSFGRIYTRDCLILEVHSGDLVGYGECVADRDPGYSYETAQTAMHILTDFILPQILGNEISDPADLQLKMESVRGHLMAKAGLEMALWDLLGKSQSRSLREMLGGVHAKVDVGVSVGLQDTPAELVRVVEGYLKQGYRRIKIKIKPGRDVVDARLVRDSFPDLRLQVDANSAYRLDTADALLPLDELNLLLIEQPLQEDDIWDHAKVQRKFKTPICLDESILSAVHARQALEMESCRVINIKAGRVGGLYEAVKIHNLCREREIPVWCGGMLETGVGRASNLALASLPGFVLPGDISASDRYYKEDITVERFRLNSDSTIDVPVGVGLGVQIDPVALDRATIKAEKIS